VDGGVPENHGGGAVRTVDPRGVSGPLDSARGEAATARPGTRIVTIEGEHMALFTNAAVLAAAPLDTGSLTTEGKTPW
jgi:hypothetical protein